jgi:hypothetical protein
MAAAVARDDPWGDADAECEICCERENTHRHATCGKKMCSDCLGSIVAKAQVVGTAPLCPHCRGSLAGAGAILPVAVGPDPRVETVTENVPPLIDEGDADEKDPVIAAAVERAMAPDMVAARAVATRAALVAAKLAAEAKLRHDSGKPGCCHGVTRVLIKDTDGIRFELMVDLALRVEQIKACIGFRCGVCPAEMRLILRGIPMADGVTLERQRVKTGDTLCLVRQMRGS